MLTDKRILVTGATGQVARYVTEELATRNQVWAAARFRDEQARDELEAQGIGIAPFTMGDADLSALPDVDYVIHCAADVGPATADEAMTTNAEGTGFVMERYRDAEGFFHMSSCGVYRPKEGTEPVTEDDILGGFMASSPHYSMSKLVSESVVRFQARRLDLPTVIARLDVAYGASGHGGLPMVLVDLMKAGIPFQLQEGNPGYCSPIHESDIAAQIEGLLAHASVPATVCNLGGDDVVTIVEMIEYLEELTGLSMTKVEADSPMFETQAISAVRRNELAGPCAIPWRDGLRDALERR